MADEKQQLSDEHLQHSDVRYEPDTMRVRGVIIGAVVGVCILAVVGCVIWGFFWWREAAGRQARTSPYSALAKPATGASADLPPEPRLEQLNRMISPNPGDVSRILSEKEKVLNSSGPTDEKGFVHIPIRVAMKQLVADAAAGKLPQRKEPPLSSAHDQGLLDSGESNAGRVFQGARQ